MITLKKQLLLALLGLFIVLPLQAQSEAPTVIAESLLIDVPTAHVLDRYQASFTTRAYEHGTVMESIHFGVYPQINLGISLAIHELLGSSSSVKVLEPAFQAKWKIYDGSLYLPAISIGYDGRKYGYGYTNNRTYNKKSSHYLDNRKGGYLSLSREVIIPGLEATAGLNLSDFDSHELYMFYGLLYQLSHTVGLLAEWDGIRNIRDSRLNLGARFYLHPHLALDAAIRRIGRGDESERVLQLRYVTNF